MLFSLEMFLFRQHMYHIKRWAFQLNETTMNDKFMTVFIAHAFDAMMAQQLPV